MTRSRIVAALVALVTAVAATTVGRIAIDAYRDGREALKGKDVATRAEYALSGLERNFVRSPHDQAKDFLLTGKGTPPRRGYLQSLDLRESNGVAKLDGLDAALRDDPTLVEGLRQLDRRASLRTDELRRLHMAWATSLRADVARVRSGSPPGSPDPKLMTQYLDVVDELFQLTRTRRGIQEVAAMQTAQANRRLGTAALVFGILMVLLGGLAAAALARRRAA
jgi:CHASE3 domain sensor protein